MSAAKKGRPARNKGVPASEAQKRKQSEAQKRNAKTQKFHEDQQNRIAAARTEAARAKNSASKKGRKLSLEARAAMSASHRRRCDNETEEQRYARGVWRGIPRPEHGEKLKGRPMPDRRSLTYAQAEQIRAEKAAGASYKELSIKFGLNVSPLHRIVHRKTYAQPTDDEPKD